MHPRYVFLIFAAVLLIAGAGMERTASADDGVPLPTVSKGQGDACVRDTAFMRTHHMELLKHQRDDTVHEGIRPEQENLKECIACHAVPNSDGKPVGIDSPKHFCRACHDYAAVTVDCFDCHASRPGDAEKLSQRPMKTIGEVLSEVVSK